MSSLHPAHGSSEQFGAELSQDMGLIQSIDAGEDPIEAYFECITQCSLDDGECVTVCTTILREVG
jgi:hypothetical protein